ncbi:hypothetical protein [Brevibacterium casei]|uniref:hypothetical protein n=1 Tax=Brevibacterium casei TaxID=33889 RepID=UPI0028A660A5|nr:hypothetical protein [Brevibacterium casei]
MSTTPTSNLDELIEQERRRAAERIAKLKRAAVAEQRRIDARVVELLREQKPDLYNILAREATDALASEKAKRSRRARKASSPSPDVLDGVVSQVAEQVSEEEASWNG